MDAKWIPYRISWHFALILELTCIDSLRDSDFDFRTLTMLGTQVFRKRSAQRSALRLRAAVVPTSCTEKYFVSANCADASADSSPKANVVPWIDAEDPVNGSFVAVFVDPVLINKIRAGTPDKAKLCAAQSDDTHCVCKLSGERPLGVLGRMLAALPHSKKAQALQRISMENCPEGVPDLLAGTVLASLVLILGVSVWMLCMSAASERLQEPVAPLQSLAEVKSPMQNFLSSFSWAAGFLLSLMALQTGALAVVRKSSEEAPVWIVAAGPVALALAAALRLSQLLAKKQLVHAFLKWDVIITDLPDDVILDAMLVVAILAYFLFILYLVSIDLQTLVVALTALGSALWTVLKAVSTARDLDQGLKLVEINSASLVKSTERLNMKPLPWAKLLALSDEEELRKLLESDSGTGSTLPSSTASSRRWSLTSVARQGPLLRFLSRSRAGFLVLPAFLALVAFSCCVSAGHMTAYACSVGELADLKLASSLHSLEFLPWQTRYEVASDVSFTKLGAAVEEIQLSHRQVPRVATIRVQGLRPSRPETTYEVRFSPSATMPAALRITAQEFQRTIAWSSLPGSVFSIPEGLQDFRFEVQLADFLLGLPRPRSHGPAALGQLWTTYNDRPNATEQSCSADCGHDLACLESYVGPGGCYAVLADRKGLESGDLPQNLSTSLKAAEQNLTGRLSGCRLEEVRVAGEAEEAKRGKTTQCSDEVEMKPGQLQLPFGRVQPDWAFRLATLSFALELETGGQKFEAEATPISFRQGTPPPSDAMAMLVGQNASGSFVLKTESSLDVQGNVVISVSKYDPLAFDTLRLLVMPMLPDPAFRANWSEWSPATKADLQVLQRHGRCLESGLIRWRYSICGAYHGSNDSSALGDEPLAVQINPILGQMEAAPQFTVVVRQKAREWGFSSSHRHTVVMQYEAVDSPAAWAAQLHGCSLLNVSTIAEGAVLASADGLCELLASCHAQLCEQVREQSLGGKKTYDLGRGQNVHPPALLLPAGTVKLFSCMGQAAPSCSETIRTQWHYKQSQVSMKGYSLAFSIKTLLGQASNGTSLSLLMEIRRNLTKQNAERFDEDAAREVWRLPEPSGDLLATLAVLDEEMPVLLAEALMKSPLGTMPPVTPQVQAAFGNLTKLLVSLEDAAQLGQLGALAQLAPKLRVLTISCALCPVDRKFPEPEALRSFERLSALEKLALTRFRLWTLRDQAFGSLGGLKWLNLYGNQLQSLEPGAFQGLQELKGLYLSDNQLQSLEPGAFQGLGGLKKLDLGFNHLRSLKPGAFQGLKGLKELDLGVNHLQSLEPNAFQGLKGLKELVLEGNPLQTPPAICKEEGRKSGEASTKGSESGPLPVRSLGGSAVLFLDLLGLMDVLAGRVALVTGGGSGIGFEAWDLEGAHNEKLCQTGLKQGADAGLRVIVGMQAEDMACRATSTGGALVPAASACGIGPEGTSQEECPEICTSPSGRSGSYELHGEAARSLGKAKYFVSANCADASADSSPKANVVPWIDAEDPVNGSFVAIFVDPVLINKIRAGTSDKAKLCAAQSDDALCVCKLSGERPLGVLGRMLAALPHSKKAQALQISMENCPEGVPDLLAGTVLASLVLILGASVWMACISAASDRLEEPEPATLNQSFVRVKSPMQNFLSSFSWAAGFLLSLMALQTGALAVVRKSSEEEAPVWIVAACPAALALAAALRLSQLLVKKQLVHAFLKWDVIITDLPDDVILDAVLVVAILAYFLFILYLVSIDLQTLVVALTALGSALWTVLKAVSTARDLDNSLETVEMGSSCLVAGTVRLEMKPLPWATLLALKEPQELRKLLESDFGTGSTLPSSTASSRSWSLTSVARQGPLLRFLSRSYAGFLVLPAFLALVAFSCCVSAGHMTAYACSVGELADLKLASSLHSLEFLPWQTRYEVTSDVSFTKLALMAWVQPSTTRLISITQPQAASMPPSSPRVIAVDEKQGAAVEEIQLSHRQIPRVATIRVQGLRPSRRETTYEVRFSPSATMPAALRITAQEFQRTIAWSSLPGSVFSIPEGLQDFRFEVQLADFLLGLPWPRSHGPAALGQLWTTYRDRPNATVQSCSADCGHDLACLESYVGPGGCYAVLADRKGLEAGDLPQNLSTSLKAAEQNLTGRLSGCRLEEVRAAGEAEEAKRGKTTQCRDDVEMKPGQLQLPFGRVQPDWAFHLATLSFALELETGGQKFEAEATPIFFRQGSPPPSDAMAMLVGQNASGSFVLKTESSLDVQGNVVISVSKYDPLAFDTLRLLVMPMLPDPAFRANWSEWSPATKADLQLLQGHGRCLESGLVRWRYSICGAYHGSNDSSALGDEPLSVQITPIQGQMEAASQFTVVVRQKAREWGFSSSQWHTVVMQYEAVDSPAAWAAQLHGCSLLNVSTIAEGAVLASADGLCELLPTCHGQLCKQVREQSLGGTKTIDMASGQEVHPPPLLSPAGTVKLLACMGQAAPSCSETIRTQWHYKQSQLGMEGYSLAFSVKTLLDQASSSTALSLLKDIRSNLNQEDAGRFDVDAVREVWRLPDSSGDLLSTLAVLDEKMPQRLAEALVKSPLGTMPHVTPQVQVAFADLTKMQVSLEDAAQLGQLGALAQLAPKLRVLQISCTLCPADRKIPEPETLRSFERLSALGALRLSKFRLLTLRAKAFGSLGELKGLRLTGNQLRGLQPGAFQGLKELKTLSLYGNQLQSLEPGAFQGLEGLKVLVLEGNPLQTPPAICKQGVECDI
ncbi:Lingo4 [Symbiodinium sp. CCMP2592]|nr:Lingo4 [Symbiodinium sp. CCMP2592]